MTTTTIELPLYNDPYFSYDIDLQGTNRKLTFRWNERASSWHFDIIHDTGEPVVLGVRMVKNYPMLIDYELTGFGLNGYFALVDAGEYKSGKLSTSPEALVQWYRLFYIYTTED